MKRYLVLLLIAECCFAKTSENDIYTLYRNSYEKLNDRTHVATFDANLSDRTSISNYNRRNCEIAQELFQKTVLFDGGRYWCEKGKYKK